MPGNTIVSLLSLAYQQRLGLPSLILALLRPSNGNVPYRWVMKAGVQREIEHPV